MLTLHNVMWLCCLGVYLPLLWEASFCWKTPIALGYTRGHFSALVAIASSPQSGDSHVTYLPLVDSEGRLLCIHFLSEQEVSIFRECKV